MSGEKNSNETASASTIDCPLCHESFTKDAIEHHADLCLDSRSSDEQAAANLFPDRSKKKPRLLQSPPTPSSPHAYGIAYTPSARDSECETELETPKRKTSSRQTSKLNSHVDSPGTRSQQGTIIKSSPSANRTIHPTTARSMTMSNFFAPRQASTSSTSNKRLAVTDDGPASFLNSAAASRYAYDHKPLADQMRPKCLDDFVGQKRILAPNSILRSLIESKEYPSMILWGPPGCGKTSLAHIVSASCRASNDFNFVTMSATNSGVSDVKDVVMRAKNDKTLLKRKTILFIDEIHRFNKLQQDTFLPHVENGTIILIGATTENPSFSLNSSLLSRCRVFVMEKLSVDPVIEILNRAAKKLEIAVVVSPDNLPENPTSRFIETNALKSLAELCDGDARIALNCLSMAVQFETARRAAETPTYDEKPFVITIEHIQETLQRSHLLYDRKGDEHFNCISALHKSMRGSDGNAALYWLGRILEGGEDPRYVSRRLIRFASEDIGLADPQALTQAIAAHEACQFIGMPECDVVLAQCVVYLSEAPKSVRIYDAYKRVKECITSHKGPLPSVPIHLRNANTKLDRQLGYGKDYIYNPHYTGTEPINQVYLPEGLEDRVFLEAA